MDIIGFSDELKHAIQISQALARENSNEQFSPAHLLKALLNKDSGIRDFLKHLDKDIFYIEEWAEVRIETYPKTSKIPELIKADNAALTVLNEADNVRLKLSEDQTSLVSVFIAICTPGVGFTYEQLKTLPVTPTEIFASITQKDTLNKAMGKSAGTAQSVSIKNTSLLKFTNDKIELARLGKLEKVIGREKEIRMIAEVLNRRTNSNIILIGDPGVGKTSVINGFCQLVADEKSSRFLNNLNIFDISFGNLVAGASYKGEVEDRLNSIFAEIKTFDHAILIIEDLHELIDKNGSAPGAANIIKQELNKGEITLLATTTIDNYTKIIEKDNALKRYFEVLKIEEATDPEVFSILKEIIPAYYSTHHGLSISEEVIHESIRLTRRYLKERSLPSAAIDLIDRTMAVVKTAQDFTAPTLDEIESELLKVLEANLEEQKNEQVKALHWQLVKRINPIVLAYIDEEINPDQHTDAALSIGYLQNSLAKFKDIAIAGKNSIEINDISAVVAQKTNIPIGKLQSGEREKLLNFEQYLTQRVIGQDHAIKIINEAILESRSGLNKAGQPIGSFFFLGPTGTGKTELAKTLAEFLFNDESSMIRFDMSEFKEEHSAALLYGAPPGYVGYEQGGVLVNKIRQRPYSVVLFDEIEKAHPSVFDIFLQILDEGKLHDRLGKEGDFSNAVVIFTSNIGSKYVIDSFANNEIPSSGNLMEIMAKHFRPEFLGRLTEIIPFAPITQGIAVKILEIHMRALFKTLENQKIRLEIGTEAKEKLATLGFNPLYGARPLIGIIRNQLRRPLSRMIIAGELAEGSAIRLACHSDVFSWEKPEN
jgi:ATP-dependent Clp protease ATP-binding subunit ClpA